jgi:hypothetical protein
MVCVLPALSSLRGQIPDQMSWASVGTRLMSMPISGINDPCAKVFDAWDRDYSLDVEAKGCESGLHLPVIWRWETQHKAMVQPHAGTQGPARIVLTR